MTAFSNKINQRPFGSFLDIANESHIIAIAPVLIPNPTDGIQPGIPAYFIKLNEIPGAPPNYTVLIPGYTEVVNTPPSAFQFSVDYKTGYISFYSTAVGITVLVTYTGTGSIVDAQDINTIQDAIASISTVIDTEEFIATSSQTVFTTAQAFSPNGSNLFVYLNGLLMEIGSPNDYTITGTHTITFTSPLISGDKVTAIIFASLTGGGGSGVPGGTNGAVQFNDSNSFGGDASKFFWDNTNKKLIVGNSFAQVAADFFDFSGQTKNFFAHLSNADTSCTDTIFFFESSGSTVLNFGQSFATQHVGNRSNNSPINELMSGVSGQAYDEGSGKAGDLTGVSGYVENDGGIIGVASSFRAIGNFHSATTTVINAGLYLDNQTGSGAISDYQIYSNTTNPFVARSDGRVGVGTASPVSLFSVGSSSQFQVGSTGIVTAGTWSADTIVPLHGGTGDSSLTAHGVLIGEGTSSVALAGPSSLTYSVLMSQGLASDPSFLPLNAGSNVSLTTGTGGITIASSGGGSTFSLVSTATYSTDQSSVSISLPDTTSIYTLVYDLKWTGTTSGGMSITINSDSGANYDSFTHGIRTDTGGTLNGLNAGLPYFSLAGTAAGISSGTSFHGSVTFGPSGYNKVNFWSGNTIYTGVAVSQVIQNIFGQYFGASAASSFQLTAQGGSGQLFQGTYWLYKQVTS